MIFLALTSLTWSPVHAAEVQTGDRGHAQNPVWSPDGKWLAFEINNLNAAQELWLVSVEGGEPGGPKQLSIPGARSAFSGGNSMVANPSWTPDNTVIFEGSNASGIIRLYYATPSGSSPNELITSSQLAGNLSFPASSPDGNKLAFVSDASGNGDVYVWNIASSTIAPIFKSSPPDHAPAYAPDSETLVFSRGNQGDEDLFLWSGGSTTPGLLGGQGDQTRPIWAGSQIVYFSSSAEEGEWEIWVASSSPGGGKQRLADEVKLPIRAQPALTPDRDAVIYASSDPTYGDKLYVAYLDGSGTYELPTGLVSVAEPQIVRAGGKSYLAFTALPAEGSDWRRMHIMDVTGRY